MGILSGNMEFCNKILRSGTLSNMECKLEKDHHGICDSYPFLKHLILIQKKLSDKIKQDAYHTRGNKTKPFKNRSVRWDRPISQEEAKNLKNENDLGIPKKEHSSQEECFKVARKITRLIYEMDDAPVCPPEIQKYLDQEPDKKDNPCICPLCLEKIKISDFKENVWGMAKIELWHITPLSDNTPNHDADNLGWGHRTCNIAQQERTTDETIDWMESLVKKHRKSSEEGEELVE